MLGTYIEYLKNRICLWYLISTKEITRVFKDKTGFTPHFLHIYDFFAPKCMQNTGPRIWRLFQWQFLKRNVIGS